MKFGLTTPVVTLSPRSHAAWEIAAGPEQIREIVVAADRLGYAHVTCSEHVGIPAEAVAERGGRYYDPLSTLGYVAAVTRRVRLVTHVIVLPYSHPLEVAKRYGTLDHLSGGRLVLGVGVGSLEPEFRMLGVDFAGRGPVYEDSLRALRALLGKPEPVYQGTHWRIGGFRIDPCAVQPRVPIWLGGRSLRSLRRALELGDGWDPFGLTIEQLAGLLAAARAGAPWRARVESGEAFDLVFSPERMWDPLRPEGRAGMTAMLYEYAALGATVMSLRFPSTSLQHYLEQLESFAMDVMPEFADAATRSAR